MFTDQLDGGRTRIGRAAGSGLERVGRRAIFVKAGASPDGALGVGSRQPLRSF
jgi:hypothetical protein